MISKKPLSVIHSKTELFFSPIVQDAFWGCLDPDVRNFLDSFEIKESWTYEYNELPDMFAQISKALPKVVELPPSKETKNLLHDLIPLLSSMPLRQCVSAIAWLDGHIQSEGEVGWGVVCYIEAANIYRAKSNDELFLQSKIVYERIQIMLRSTLASMIFCNLK